MGLFLSATEQFLKQVYIPLLTTMLGSEREAKSKFKLLLKQVKSDSKREGSDKFPSNFGEIMINASKTEDKYKKLMDIKYRDGIREEDILWWWNMDDLERRMMLKIDELFLVQAFLAEKDFGASDDAALLSVKSSYPRFQEVTLDIDENDTSRALPYELKDRVNVWLENPEVTKIITQKKSNFESINALIRDEIRNGNI